MPRVIKFEVLVRESDLVEMDTAISVALDNIFSNEITGALIHIRNRKAKPEDLKIAKSLGFDPAEFKED